MAENNKMNEIVSLCKRRGFVFQNSEIYGGLKSIYDFGPLGVELKRNIASEWWRHMVGERDNIYGLDSSIMMHPKVWESSGHLANFSDPLVDCYNCGERFRADKAPKLAPGTEVLYKDKQKKQYKGIVEPCGYVCPNCHSTKLSKQRQFNCMFQSQLGAVDPVYDFVEEAYDKQLSKKEFLEKLSVAVKKSAIYLRPETAQGIFVQFLNVLQTTSAKIPFGIAQIGKSFRNEIIVEHFIFRSCEFEQMEMEFFCEPGTQKEWLQYWLRERIDWHKKYVNFPENLRVRKHDVDELSHYSDDTYDIEYKFPWGWDELEGVASRTDYDLKQHAKGSGAKLTYFDLNKIHPETGKKGWRYIPYVVEPAAGLTRTFLSVLLDAYQKDVQKDAKGNERSRVYLKLHPQLAPNKVAILPLLKKENHPEKAQEITKKFRSAGIRVVYDDTSSIGKRYAKQDEIGTPWCITIDKETISDGLVTVRDRNTTVQVKKTVSQAIQEIKEKLNI